jgi:hypothetical protein
VRSLFLEIFVYRHCRRADELLWARGRTGSDFVPQLTAEAASAAGLSAQEVTDASALYTIKCAKCHKFYKPADYSQKDWDMWMRKMSRKSKLKPAQEELLTRYLGAFREKHE